MAGLSLHQCLVYVAVRDLLDRKRLTELSQGRNTTEQMTTGGLRRYVGMRRNFGVIGPEEANERNAESSGPLLRKCVTILRSFKSSGVVEYVCTYP